MRTFYRSIIVVAAFMAGCGGGDNGSNAESPVIKTSEIVTITTGQLTGVVENGSDAYKGIPYAAAPVGDLRWKPPQPVTPWAGIREANAFLSPCPQSPESTGSISAIPYLGAEDCLYLNVWTPAGRQAGERLPVMFFIHGGGNFAGSSSDSTDIIINTIGGPALYDGSRLASRGNVIVVTANYRLGPLGFIYHLAMTGNTGNFGLLDQIEALKWVQQNIEVFGGDSSRVMIFGQSGGAYDVCALLTSPLASRLFSRAMMESGVCYLHTQALMEQYTSALLQEKGCSGVPDVMQCLRNIPAEDLILAQSAQPQGLGSFTFHPFVDGYFAPDRPLTVLAQGLHNHVPFVIGSNAAEYAHRFADTIALNYPVMVADLLGLGNLGRLKEALLLYPLNGYASPQEAMVQVASDRNIVCNTKKIARQVSLVQAEPVYYYHFRRILTAPERQAAAAYHASELLYVFQHMNGVDFAADDNDRTVESHLLNYWTQFAASGNPNSANMPLWSEYDSATDPYQILDVVPVGDVQLKQDKCLFWDSLQ